MKKYRNIFIASMMASLLLSMLPIVIFYDSAALSYYSWLPIAFFLGSIVWAIIAYRLRDRGNLFFYRKGRLSTALMYTFTGEKSYAERAKYKSDIKICALIYCLAIPVYIPIAFFVTDLYSAIIMTLSCVIIDNVAIIVYMIISNMKYVADIERREEIEADLQRKEQEKRESMGKWK